MNKAVGHAPPREIKPEFAKIWLKYFFLAKDGGFKMKTIHVCNVYEFQYRIAVYITLHMYTCHSGHILKAGCNAVKPDV